MRAVEAEQYKCRLYKLTRKETGVSREAPPLKTNKDKRI